jgi:hypothetical protein
MIPEIQIPIECDGPGCKVIRLSVNGWYVVEKTRSGAHIHRWHDCLDEAMLNGKHTCGLGCAFKCASNMLTPDTTDVARESTLVLTPPLTREGTVPVSPAAVEETSEPKGEE